MQGTYLLILYINLQNQIIVPLIILSLMKEVVMNNNLDMRVRKTYTCLTNTLLELLKEKNFEDITVNELCSKAMVGRGTFYKHFTDKYEFFSFALREIQEHYLTEAEASISDDDPCSYYTAFFEAFIKFIENNRASFGSLTVGSMASVILSSTSDTVSNSLEEHLKKDEREGHLLSIPPTAAARFLTGAMAQSARYLIEHPGFSSNYFVKNIRILIGKMFE